MDHMFRLQTLQLDCFVTHVRRIFDYILSSYAFHSAHIPTHLSPRVFQITRTASDSCGSFFPFNFPKRGSANPERMLRIQQMGRV